MDATPIGFVARQSYEKMKEGRMDFTVFGRRIQLTIVEGIKGSLDPRQQALGAAPNFVLSLDASHLLATVHLCVRDGITSFAMVHDSYGTHARDVEALSGALREAFVWQYGQHDVLQQFRDSLVQQLPAEVAAELPPVPNKGRLDLDGVLRSDYFFA